MARYQVMYWKHIPSQVKAWEGEGEGRAEVKLMLPARFQAAIDAYAMRDGSTGMDAYLEGWHWGPMATRPGTPDQIAPAVAAELDAEFTRSRLMEPRADEDRAGPREEP